MITALIITTISLVFILGAMIWLLKYHFDTIRQKDQEIYQLKSSNTRHINELGKRSGVEFDDFLHLKHK